MNDQAKALLFVAALFGGCGFTGGRVTAPETPAEVRVVRIPPRPQFVPAPVARVLEPVPAPAPPAAHVAESDMKPPLPVARPNVEPKPKEREQPKAHPKPTPRPVRKPTAVECGQLKLGMLTIGREGVNTKARARGYSAAQVSWALSACGL